MPDDGNDVWRFCHFIWVFLKKKNTDFQREIWEKRTKRRNENETAIQGGELRLMYYIEHNIEKASIGNDKKGHQDSHPANSKWKVDIEAVVGYGVNGSIVDLVGPTSAVMSGQLTKSTTESGQTS